MSDQQELGELLDSIFTDEAQNEAIAAGATEWKKIEGLPSATDVLKQALADPATPTDVADLIEALLLRDLDDGDV